MHREAQQRGDSNFLEREPLQSWLGDAIFSTDTDEFRRNVADNARELDESVADTSVLVHRLAEWKIDIKSGGRPVGLYVPRLVLEREITVVDPKFDLYRDNDEPSGQAGFAEAHQRLLADPSLANDWLVLTAAFGEDICRLPAREAWSYADPLVPRRPRRPWRPRRDCRHGARSAIEMGS